MNLSIRTAAHGSGARPAAPTLALAGLALVAATAAAQSTMLGRVVTAAQPAPIISAPAAVYHVQHAAKPPHLDASGAGWSDVPAMAVGAVERPGSARASAAAPDDPKDLSGSLRLLWDEQSLYFHLEVVDDAHQAPNADEAFWANDCCQFIFDGYMNGPEGVYDGEERSFCVCDTPQGPTLAQYRVRVFGRGLDVETRVPDVPVKMALRTDGVRVYEWALPWDRLYPISPWILGRSGFSFALNDNDGKGFKGGKAWTPGILWKQDASRFGQVVFDGALGARTAALPIPPEFQWQQTQTNSEWLDIRGVPSFETARLLACAAQAGPIEAEVAVYRHGEPEPMLRSRLSHTAAARELVAFVWDLSRLPDGRYEVTYQVTGLDPQPSRRYPLCRANMDILRQGLEKLRPTYGLDRPYDELPGAPALVRRHRGMVAAASDLLERGPWTQELLAAYPDGLLQALQAAKDMLTELAQGHDYQGQQRGQFLAASFSPADGTGQPFVLRVPTNYDAASKWPLVVRLHGQGGRPMPGLADPGRTDVLEVLPWGRGSQSYMGLGEDDVLRAIAYVKEWYNVDPDRVYVTGGSMGGWGTYWMASRHPDMFAAASVRCGYSSGIRLENLRHVPIWIQQGALDTSSVLDVARHAVDSLRQLGYGVTYREYAEVSHNVTDRIDSVTQMLAARRPAQPDAVTLTCECPEMGQAYWLSVRQFTDPHRLARVDARLSGPATYQVLSVKADNVDVCALDTRRMPLAPAAALHVQVGSRELVQAPPIPAQLFVVRTPDGWTLSTAWTNQRTAVRSYRPGAAANLYTGEPLMIVYGTAATERKNEWLRAAANRLARFGGRPTYPLVPGGFAVKADTAVTGDDLLRYNLILLGGAKENRLAGRIAGQVPIRLSEAGELLAGGRAPVSIKGAAVRFHYYNPLSPGRLIYWAWTDEETDEARAWLTTPAAVMELDHGLDRLDQPDLAVLSIASFDQAAAKGASRARPQRRLMQFTHDWQWRVLPGQDTKFSPADPKVLSGLARLRVIRQITGAEYAVGPAGSDETGAYDREWITLADTAIRQSPEQTLICTVKGKDLIALRQTPVDQERWLIHPAAEPSALDPARTYRIAMALDTAWGLWAAKDVMHDVQAGPEYEPEAVQREMLGL